MSLRFLFVGNSTTISFDLLDVDGAPATGATMEATLYAGTEEVAGQDWPLDLTETETPGTYSGVLLSSLEITDGQSLRLVVTAEHNSSTARWENLLQGAFRRLIPALTT